MYSQWWKNKKKTEQGKLTSPTTPVGSPVYFEGNPVGWSSALTWQVAPNLRYHSQQFTGNLSLTWTPASWSHCEELWNPLSKPVVGKFNLGCRTFKHLTAPVKFKSHLPMRPVNILLILNTAIYNRIFIFIQNYSLQRVNMCSNKMKFYDESNKKWFKIWRTFY